MKTTLALSIFVLAAISLSAQENENTERLRYSNITEFGFITASPKGISLEAVTVQGFSVDKTHYLGLGIGMGVNFYSGTVYDFGYGSGSYSELRTAPYMPVFLNYRFYFKPNKVFSPHVNIALGGLVDEDGKGGAYSVLTMGFRAGKFSFSSGLSLMAINRQVGELRDYDPNIWYPPYSPYVVYKDKWFFPFGLVVKCGFSF
ncbi:MAG: hypothetical protein FWH36_01885 [Lentimicrobiaceae bacterium]|nr:hypothetical protein [Lentimicrobiaceae bacterium]